MPKKSHGGVVAPDYLATKFRPFFGMTKEAIKKQERVEGAWYIADHDRAARALADAARPGDVAVKGTILSERPTVDKVLSQILGLTANNEGASLIGGGTLVTPCSSASPN